MKKSKFKINAQGMKFSIGERTVMLDKKITEADAMLIAEQFPKEKYVEIIDTKSTNQDGTDTKIKG